MSSQTLTVFTFIASKGSGAHLLKVGSKRRRTKAEIRDSKQRIDAKDSEFDLRMDRIRELEVELNNSISKERQKLECPRHLAEPDQLERVACR